MEATEQDIKKMVDRFLGWTLPKKFSPDAGIDFTPPSKLYPAMENPDACWPTGTNLLCAEQAEQMIRYILSDEQLLACPFCGADGAFLTKMHLSSDEYEGETINCTNCHAQVPTDSWQTRA